MQVILLICKYYEWDFIKELPLSLLGELISAAVKQDRERQLLPLWLTDYAVKTIQHEAVMSFSDFISSVLPAADTTTATKKEQTAEEIIKEFAPLIAADELRRAKHGGNI